LLEIMDQEYCRARPDHPPQTATHVLITLEHAESLPVRSSDGAQHISTHDVPPVADHRLPQEAGTAPGLPSLSFQCTGRHHPKGEGAKRRTRGCVIRGRSPRWRPLPGRQVFALTPAPATVVSPIPL